MTRDTLTVLMLSAELSPYTEVGELGETVGALSSTLTEMGHRVLVFMPRYGSISPKWMVSFQPVYRVGVNMAGHTYEGTVWRGRRPHSSVLVYLIEQPELFARPGVYRQLDGEQFPDEALRLVYYNRAVIETLRGLKLRGDVLHAHDHHAALAVAYLKTIYSADTRFRQLGSVLTAHDLAFQALYDPAVLAYTGLPPDTAAPASPFEYWGRVNFLKAGVLFADLVTTSSSRYALEVTWSDRYAHGLAGVMRERQADLLGVLPGLDTMVWNPAEDSALAAQFSARALAGKAQQKRAFATELGLDPVSRPLVLCATDGRGADGGALVLECRDAIRERGADLIVLTAAGGTEVASGRGSRGALVVTEAGDAACWRRALGAADLLVRPAHSDPAGLVAAQAMRYGVVPVVRAAGGLACRVVPFEPDSRYGNGFVHLGATAGEFLEALDEGLRIYAVPDLWRLLVQRALTTDVSWEAAAKRYVSLYRRAGERKASTNLRSWDQHTEHH